MTFICWYSNTYFTFHVILLLDHLYIPSFEVQLFLFADPIYIQTVSSSLSLNKINVPIFCYIGIHSPCMDYGCEIYWLRQPPDFQYIKGNFLCSIFRSIISAKDKGKDVNNPFSIFSFVKKIGPKYVQLPSYFLKTSSNKDRKTDFSSVYGLAHNDIFCMVQKLVW